MISTDLVEVPRPIALAYGRVLPLVWLLRLANYAVAPIIAPVVVVVAVVAHRLYATRT